MPVEIDIKEFLKLKDQIPAFDVRTSAEYEQGHIPGIHNLPLFSIEERAIVGTLYKKEGKEKAVYQGLEFVGPKMTSYIDQVKETSDSQELLFHCWRGGMRSKSMAWLFETMGKKTYTLKDGYKSYRHEQIKSFNQKSNVIILGGMTGSGKTEILYKLREKGEQILDLEKLANHKGSSFGSIGENAQPSSEQYSNLIFEEWRKFDHNRAIWLEDESHSVGSCFILEELWTHMRKAKVVKLEIPKEDRIKRLIKYYTVEDKEALIAATERINKRLGGQFVKTAVELIKNEDYSGAVDIILNYYDKAYLHGISKRPEENIHSLNIDFSNEEYTNEIIAVRKVLMK